MEMPKTKGVVGTVPILKSRLPPNREMRFWELVQILREFY